MCSRTLSFSCRFKSRLNNLILGHDFLSKNNNNDVQRYLRDSSTAHTFRASRVPLCLVRMRTASIKRINQKLASIDTNLSKSPLEAVGHPSNNYTHLFSSPSIRYCDVALARSPAEVFHEPAGPASDSRQTLCNETMVLLTVRRPAIGTKLSLECWPCGAPRGWPESRSEPAALCPTSSFILLHL